MIEGHLRAIGDGAHFDKVEEGRLGEHLGLKGKLEGFEEALVVEPYDTLVRAPPCLPPLAEAVHEHGLDGELAVRELVCGGDTVSQARAEESIWRTRVCEESRIAFDEGVSLEVVVLEPVEGALEILKT